MAGVDALTSGEALTKFIYDGAGLKFGDGHVGGTVAGFHDHGAVGHLPLTVAGHQPAQGAGATTPNCNPAFDFHFGPDVATGIDLFAALAEGQLCLMKHVGGDRAAGVGAGVNRNPAGAAGVHYQRSWAGNQI